ncbi:MAG: translation initiation factor IF-3 [Spirochaetes bacterium]|nr:translation initiation factor IF-3 [Spirochaetota bacterium]
MAKDQEKRINTFIREREVRLIGEEGEQVGVVPIEDALERSQSSGLDLVEISPNASPPVCKIMDFGKFKFEEQKRLKEAKKKQKIVHLKEVKFRPKIDGHDFEFKARNVLRFLERGDKVKITIRFRGREMAHTDLGFKIADRVNEFLEDKLPIIEEKRAGLEGRNIIMVLAPGKGNIKKKTENKDIEKTTGGSENA